MSETISETVRLAAIELFDGNTSKAEQWLNSPCKVLGYSSPVEAMNKTGPEKEKEVLNLIYGLEHGVFQ